MKFRTRARPAGFTLVELLVVIGIIALLIGILLPALNRAREQANSIKCLSNVRQIALATIIFAQDHKGYMPTCSDDGYARLADPYKVKFVYRDSNNGTGGSVYDWASSLAPYLGSKFTDPNNFLQQPGSQSKAWVCPSDRWQDGTPSAGYGIISNYYNFNPTVNPKGYAPISYGVNADICCLVDANNIGRVGQNDPQQYSAMGGPPGGGGTSMPLRCELFHVFMPSQVLLYGDCGTRPTEPNGAIVYQNDALYYTTDYIYAAGLPTGSPICTMDAASKTYLAGKMPITTTKLPNQVPGNKGRHPSNRINIAFCDGHAEGIMPNDWSRVRISPYHPIVQGQ